MQIFAGWVVVLAGAAMTTWSTQLLVRANPGRRIPYLVSPEQTPRRSILLRAGGAGVLVLGAALLAPLIDVLGVALIVCGFLPSLVWIAIHNRRAAASAEADAR
ncbi:hypothetical protein [Agromyces sp. NPDC056965]|uniref:hypothetical protein n=1 Tax=Agromyces sp. NPDC056965 TaxID=3345983 RepID=UPI00363F13EA